MNLTSIHNHSFSFVATPLPESWGQSPVDAFFKKMAEDIEMSVNALVPTVKLAVQYSNILDVETNPDGGIGRFTFTVKTSAP
jgi:hypothetical protein